LQQIYRLDSLPVTVLLKQPYKNKLSLYANHKSNLTSLLSGVINITNRCITPFPIKPTLDRAKRVWKATGLERDSRAAEGIASVCPVFLLDFEYPSAITKRARTKGGKPYV
jgi:hypothetical protein